MASAERTCRCACPFGAVKDALLPSQRLVFMLHLANQLRLDSAEAAALGRAEATASDVEMGTAAMDVLLYGGDGLDPTCVPPLPP